MRHANADANAGAYPDYWWEIRVYDAKLQFSHKQNVLRMETEKTLAELGVSANTWHHGAIVYDRYTREASHMFVDGIQVDRLVTSFNNDISAEVDAPPFRYDPVVFGQGDSEFEGMLDEFRIYHRILTPTEVSILYQTDYTTHAFALEPFPNASNVLVTTGLKWAPDPNATSQTLYFDDDNDVCTAPIYSLVDTSKDTCSVSNVSIRGDANSLALGVPYYWAVDTNVNGTLYRGPVWKFTAETGKAFNPVPANGQQNVPVGAVDLQWDASASASDFNVYCSDNQSLVADMCDAVLVADVNIHDTNVPFAASIRAEDYYWRVVTNFPPEINLPSVAGDVWNFRTQPKLIIVNTSDANADYNGVAYTAKTLKFIEEGNVVNGYLGDDDAAIFDFNSNLNLDEHYSIIVIPMFDNVLEANMASGGYRKTSRPMAIHVNGDVNLNCKIEAYAPEAPVNQGGPSSQARSGGHRGSYRTENRTALDPIEIFGPGYGATSTDTRYSCGAGGGYGGKGGDQARAGGGSGGDAYGYIQIPVPLGGSAGGWSNNVTGGGGGGAVEIAATGNVTLGAEAKVFVSGGKAVPAGYAAGGGAGGSVRIIAGGNFTNSGVVDANGGKGGDTTKTDESTNTGGGGGGGRVAVFHGGSYTAGNISVAGGARGGRPEEDQNTTSRAGAVGTIFESNQTPLKPDYPTPANGANAAITNGKVTLKWYPGFDATKNTIYFGTSTDPPYVAEINGVPAKGGVLRAQQSYDVNVTDGQTYHWYIKATGSDVNSDTWSFVAVNDFKLIFNTSDVNTVIYDGNSIAPLTCRIRDANGFEAAVIATGSVVADGVAIFDFNGFNYNQNYTIVVLPEYDYTFDNNVMANKPSRPLAIHVNGDFYFDGRLDISGDDTASSSADQPKARSGGYRGARAGISKSSPAEEAYYPVSTLPSPYTERFGIDRGTGRTYYLPVDPGAYKVFGPGIGKIIPPMEVGGGGGYGGLGGDSGRGFYYGMFAGGYPYGDKEIPVPYGGSAGGWGRNTAGGAGGGGVEIVATGSVTLGSNAEIYSEGGSVLLKGNKPGGGGAGGSVRIIAGTSFSNSGIVDVNGGSGGITDEGSYKVNQGGGGGAGGRISIYYGTTYANTGTMTDVGGAKGWCYGTGPGDPCYGYTYASDGQNGTVFTSRYDANGVPMKASAPTPRSGDDMVYCPNDVTGNSLTLKWYSGYYNGTAATDAVYFGTSPNPVTQITTRTVTARGQQQTVDVNTDPNKTYYWKVRTTSGAITVDSDIWWFKAVNWQCANPMLDSIPWDTGPYCDCFIDLKDYDDLGNIWYVPPVGSVKNHPSFGALAEFANEWLVSTRQR
jgi:hypothetical protein